MRACQIARKLGVSLEEAKELKKEAHKSVDDWKFPKKIIIEHEIEEESENGES